MANLELTAPAAVVESQPRASLPEQSSSTWESAQSELAFEPLASDLDVDVAVVGGGITGLSTALALLETGRKVALIDAGRLASGETARTTAHLTEVPDARAHALREKFGVDRARLVWEAGRAAIQHIAANVMQHRIECEFRRVSGSLFTERHEGVDALRKELEASRELGVDAEWLSFDGDLPFDTRGAVRFGGQAQFHPLAYAHGLIAALAQGGCRLFENTSALEVSEHPAPRVVTSSGVIRARDVVVATNVPLNKVMLQTKIASYRSYAIAVRIDGPAPQGLHWDDLDPYHYIRSHGPVGAQQLIVGGEDHRTGQEDDTLAPFERLFAWTAERFPVRAVTNRWSGQIVEPVDGMPYIGRNSFSSNVWEATGFSGNGMTFGTIAAVILRDALLERANPWSALFDATRITPLASARDYVRENVDFPLHFVADRLHRAPRDLEALQPGEGRIVSFENRKCAAYRDEQGGLHLLAPKCTHLGCLVEFNRAEKTWDCPCHGARYAPDGAVINGPAVQPLEPFHGAARSAD